MSYSLVKKITRQRIEEFEGFLKQQELVELSVKHYFSHGLYAREITIPKGVMLTGHIHKYTNLNILSKGDMTVTTDSGFQRIQAPFTVVSPPGTKRLAYAHEECVWTTIHATEETDVEKIKAYFVAESNQEYLEFTMEQKWLGQQ